jgi:hypothetical protein
LHDFENFRKFLARVHSPNGESSTTDAAMSLLGSCVLCKDSLCEFSVRILYAKRYTTMKKSLKIAAGSVLGLGLLFLVAGRSLGDLTGYFRASAGETVSQLEDHIPEEVHDRKLANELTSIRKEVI